MSPPTTDNASQPQPPAMPSAQKLNLSQVNAQPLAARTTMGFAWGISQALLAKLVTLVAQLLLAKLLTKADFGMVGLALSVASFVSILQFAGVQEILVARQRHLHRWLDAAFWFSGALGVFSAIACVVAGAVLAEVRNDPQYLPMLALVGLGSFFSALCTVPSALLQIQLRVRWIMSAAVLAGTLSAAVAVLLALLKFGPFSQLIAQLIAAPVQLAILWRVARPRVRWRARVRRWRFLIGDSSLLIGVGLLNNFVNQGAVLILGLLQPPSVTGAFFWGYTLSLQTITILTQNLSLVFFPALTKMQGDHPRMLAAFNRAARMLAFIGMPLCFAQAALVGPFIRFLYADKWTDAIIVAQLLSIGLGFGILGSVAVAPLKANAQFKWLFWITAGYTAFYLALVGLGGYLGSAAAVAVAVLVFNAVTAPVGTRIVLIPLGGGWGHIWSIFGPTFLLSALAVLFPVLLAQLAPTPEMRDLLTVAGVAILAPPIYLLLIRRFVPKVLHEIADQAQAVIGNRSLPGPAQRFLRWASSAPAH